MDSRFNKTLLLTVSLSCLLLSCNATRVLTIPPIGAPAQSKATASALVGSLFSVASATNKINPVITGFCSGTESPALCAKTLAPLLLQGAFDPLKALETEIEATMKQAQTVTGIILEKLADHNTPKAALDALHICKDQYSDILDTIKEALELIPQHNVVDAYYKFSSVISNKCTCDDAFTESPGVENPLVNESLTLFQLGGNCLAIMDALVNHSRL